MAETAWKVFDRATALEMGNYTSLVRKFEARPLTQKEPDARTSRRHPVLPRRLLCEIDDPTNQKLEGL